MYILGLHGNFGRSEHDSAAALVTSDGQIIAAAEEERFIRRKHAVGLMPEHSIQFCLDQAKIKIKDIDIVAFPRESWKDMGLSLEAFFTYKFGFCPRIQYVNHHLAHAAASFFISGFSSALILSIDQSGDGVSLGVFRGAGRAIELVHQEKYPNSLGLFAAMMTQYLGFQSNHEEYKVMGLAAFGEPTVDLDFLLEVNDSGFLFHDEFLHATAQRKFPELHTEQLPIFHENIEEYLPSRRLRNDPIAKEHKDLAASMQQKIEEAVFSIIRKFKTRSDRFLCLCGGVAHNSVLNGKIVQSQLFEKVFVPPAANDAGTALGAAIYASVGEGGSFAYLNSSLLGPEFSNQVIRESLESTGVRYRAVDDPSRYAANFLIEGKTVAWFQGRAEFGPRALGGRSLLADSSIAEMKDKVNKVKRRESFRPFAPSILHEYAKERIEFYSDSPFMSFTLPASELGCKEFPATLHVDGTARYQSVDKSKGLYRLLLEYFFGLTGKPGILNTSLNSGWEPIVLTPENAIAFFFSAPVDCLVIGNFTIEKEHIK